MKILGLTFLLIVFCISIKAQTSVGLEAGISNNYLNTNISDRVSTVIDYSIGYTVNIPLQYKVKQWLYIEAIPGITQKNYSIDRTDSFAGIYEKFTNSYLQIPLAVKLVYGKRLQAIGDLGIYGGYWLSSRVSGRIPNVFGEDSSGNLQEDNYNEKYQFDSQKDNRFEFGWVAGIGVQYHINQKYMLIGSCRYYQSLTDHQKTYMINQVPGYNQAFTFVLGAMMAFKK
jgi:hypothetical protein